MSHWAKSLLGAMMVCALLTPTAPAAPPPEEPMPDAVELSLQARLAITRAIEFLRQTAEQNTNGLILQPAVKGQHKLKGYEDYTINWRDEVVTTKVPIYKWEYFDHQVYRKKRSDDAHMTLVTEKRRRVKSVTYKTRTYRRRVRDKNGPIVTKHKRRIYEKGQSIQQWQVGFLGYNAMALYTMLRVGVPASDPMVVKLAASLQAYVEAYGSPDGTFDVAWLVAAFSSIPKPNKRLLAVRTMLIGKLLNGQLPSGPGAGLWGPVAQNSEILGAMFREEVTLGRALSKIKADLKKKPTSRMLKKRQKEAEDVLEEFLDLYRQLSCRGQRITGAAGTLTITPPTDYEAPEGFGDILQQAAMPALHVDYTKELTVDMESTAWALFGLRQTDIAGCLPDHVTRPRYDNKTILPPLRSSIVMERALEGITAAYSRKDKGWTEANQHIIMDAYKLTQDEGLAARQSLSLFSDHYPATDMQAYSAMVSLGYINDPARMRSANGAMLGAAEGLVEKGLEGILAGKIKRPGLQREGLDAFFFATGIARRFGTRQESRRDLWQRAAWHILRQQAADGSWGKTTYRLTSSSAMELAMARAVAKSAKAKQNSPYQDPKERANYKRSDHRGAHRHWRVPAKIVYTQMMVNFLADAVRLPVCAQWQWNAEAPKSYTLSRAVGRLDEYRTLGLSYVKLGEQVTRADLRGIPALLLSGPAPSAEAHKELLVPLRGYLEDGGLVVAETRGSSSGRRFLSDLEVQLQDMFDGAQAGEIPKDNELLAKWGEGAPTVLGVWTADGVVKAVFLPVAKKSSGAVMTPQRASIVLSRILQDRLAPGVMKPGYPMQTRTTAEPENLVDELLPDLGGGTDEQQ